MRYFVKEEKGRGKSVKRKGRRNGIKEKKLKTVKEMRVREN